MASAWGGSRGAAVRGCAEVALLSVLRCTAVCVHFSEQAGQRLGLRGRRLPVAYLHPLVVHTVQLLCRLAAASLPAHYYDFIHGSAVGIESFPSCAA